MSAKVDELFNLFETKIANLDINNLEDNTTFILRKLMDRGKTDEIFELLKDQLSNLDINNLNENIINILLIIIEKKRNNAQEVFKFIKLQLENLNLSDLDESTTDILESLIWFGESKDIFNLFETKIANLDINNLEDNTIFILRKLMDRGKTDEIFELLKDQLSNLDINNLNENIINILLIFIEKGQVDKIYQLFEVQLTSLEISNSNDISGLIFSFIKEGKLKKDFINLSEFERIQFKYRDIIDSEKVTNYKGWPDINKQISDMPIDRNSKKEHPFGWSSFKLKKDGSSTTVYIQRNKEGNATAILFKNNEISEEAISVYKEAFRVIPRYVSSAIYPELNNNKARIKVSERKQIDQDDKIIKSGGFREVYAGVSLDSINLDKIPGIIKVEILRQKEYILLMLKNNNIKHSRQGSNHTHDGNFNVRFLIEGGGKKKVSFDLNEALELMRKDKNIILTPIVILRDWDQGISTNK